MIFLIAFLYAATSLTWTAMLCAPQGLLQFLPGLVVRFTGPESRILFVLFQCEKCFAGQLALWTLPVLHVTGHIDLIWFDYFICIILSIFFAGFLGRIWNRL